MNMNGKNAKFCNDHEFWFYGTCLMPSSDFMKKIDKRTEKKYSAETSASQSDLSRNISQYGDLMAKPIAKFVL